MISAALVGGIMSVFLMGVYDPNTYRWCTVTKCGNGFDDKMLKKLQTQLDVVKINKVCCHNNGLVLMCRNGKNSVVLCGGSAEIN